MFTHTPFHRFEIACKRIKEDENYQPKITNEELLNLVKDRNGAPRHDPEKQAIAIRLLESINKQIVDLGAVFEVRIAKKMRVDEINNIPLWQIQTFALVVDRDGRKSIHNIKDILSGVINHPLPISPYEFLEKESVHPPKKGTSIRPSLGV